MPPAALRHGKNRRISVYGARRPWGGRVVGVGGDTVSVIAGKTCNATVTSGCGNIPPTVTVGSGPDGLAVDQATDTVYVANVNDNTVSVIDGATCNATVTTGCGQTPATVAVGVQPVVDELHLAVLHIQAEAGEAPYLG